MHKPDLEDQDIEVAMMMMMTQKEAKRTPTRKIQIDLANKDHPLEEIQTMRMMVMMEMMEMMMMRMRTTKTWFQP